VVARAMVNRSAADELRDACMAVALKLGGWDRNRKSKRKSSRAFKPRLARGRAMIGKRDTGHL